MGRLLEGEYFYPIRTLYGMVVQYMITPQQWTGSTHVEHIVGERWCESKLSCPKKQPNVTGQALNLYYRLSNPESSNLCLPYLSAPHSWIVHKVWWLGFSDFSENLSKKKHLTCHLILTIIHCTGMCNKCGQKVSGEGTGCTAMDKLFHIKCFLCVKCGK